MNRDEKDARQDYEAPAIRRAALPSLSPRVQAELSLRASETIPGKDFPERSNGNRFVVLSLDGTFKQAAMEFCNLIGYQENELIGKRIDTVTASQTVHIPQHLGAVVHFGQ